MHNHSRRQKNWVDRIIWILIGLLAVVFAFSSWMLYSKNRVYQLGSETYDALADAAVTNTQPMQKEPTSTAPSIPAEQEKPVFGVDFEVLRTINPNTVAWIRAENGEIDYPVVHWTDNDYYLHHLFDGTENENGAIFVDSRNAPDFLDRNTFIYGHNMDNGSMFASLVNYENAGYYEDNPTMLLVTPEESYCLQIFSGYVTSSQSSIYRVNFRGNVSFGRYLAEIQAQSDFQTDVVVTSRDRIVTLSTCYEAEGDARYVLHCKLVPLS